MHPNRGIGAVAAALAAGSFPDPIDLPADGQPEGMASGQGTTFSVGSINSGVSGHR